MWVHFYSLVNTLYERNRLVNDLAVSKFLHAAFATAPHGRGEMHCGIPSLPKCTQVPPDKITGAYLTDCELRIETWLVRSQGQRSVHIEYSKGLLQSDHLIFDL